jgi:hypothetical protein
MVFAYRQSTRGAPSWASPRVAAQHSGAVSAQRGRYAERVWHTGVPTPNTVLTSPETAHYDVSRRNASR